MTSDVKSKAVVYYCAGYSAHVNRVRLEYVNADTRFAEQIAGCEASGPRSDNANRLAHPGQLQMGQAYPINPRNG